MSTMTDSWHSYEQKKKAPTKSFCISPFTNMGTYCRKIKRIQPTIFNKRRVKYFSTAEKFVDSPCKGLSTFNHSLFRELVSLISQLEQ